MPAKAGNIDEHAVKMAGGQVLPGGAGIRVGGWTVTSSKGPIASDAEMDQMKGELGVMALPEQCYTGNHLCLTHDASGASVAFTAEAALRDWLQDASERVLVGGAEGWMASRRQEMEANNAKPIDYDWTFTTPYAGTVSPADLEGRHGNSPLWAATDEHMDRALLTSREAILYFDDVPLYESELEDNGMSQLSVKVRVMPRCWYVLLRFFLRVDLVLVRLREVRLFCRFDQQPRQQLEPGQQCAAEAPEGTAGAAICSCSSSSSSIGANVVVLREVRHQEGTFVELRAAGAPPQGAAYADPESAATVLQAVAPVGVKRYVVERAVL